MGYKSINIGNLINFAHGGGWGKESPDANYDSKVAIIRGADFPSVEVGNCSSLLIRYERHELVKNISLKSGDIVLEISGGTDNRPTGRSVIITQKLLDAIGVPAIPASFCRIIRFNDNVSSEYLYWWMQDMYNKGRTWSYQNRSTGLSNFQFKTFCDYEIVQLPEDLSQQKKVSNILSSFDKKIELNTRINTKLNELSECIINNLINLSDSEIPVKDFVTSMRNGSTPRRNVEKYWINGSIPWIKTGEVNNNFIFDTEEYITYEALKETSVSLLPINTVIMALYGSGTAGRVSIIKTEATTNQACTAMQCKSKVDAYYLFMILKSMYKKIDSLTRGSVQQNLSKDIVGDLEIPFIEEDVLQNSPLEKIFDMISNNTKENIALAELRDTLLPKLMSGEVEI